MPVARRGRLTDDEKLYIRQQSGRKSADDIAASLGRKSDVVRDFMRQANLPMEPVQSDAPGFSMTQILENLQRSAKFKRLCEELTDLEVAYFQEEYVKLMDQFRGDVLPSEEGQIYDVIRFDILKGRNMVERRKAREAIARLEDSQRRLLTVCGGDLTLLNEGQRALFMSLEGQLQEARESEQSRTTEYVKLQERQDALMKTLKSTRDQRIHEVESSQDSILGLLKKLQKDEQFRRTEGRQMKLMELAAAKEYLRLGQLHEYEDGMADRPILSADTVSLDEDEVVAAAPDPLEGFDLSEASAEQEEDIEE